MTNFPQNIEYFNRIILELFIRLYDHFPHPFHIDNQTSSDVGFGQLSGAAKDEEVSNIGIVADDIMEWLKEEGFIRYDPDPNYRPGTFWKVRLTLKGTTILGYANPKKNGLIRSCHDWFEKYLINPAGVIKGQGAISIQHVNHAGKPEFYSQRNKAQRSHSWSDSAIRSANSIRQQDRNQGSAHININIRGKYHANYINKKRKYC